MIKTFVRRATLTACLTLTTLAASAAGKYDPGASDTEIKIGQTMTYSGPASALGTLGKAMAAYFERVNAEGGINGRKIKLISLDDGYTPPKTIEQTRRLVESEQVLFIAGSLGTATNSAVRKYLNDRKVPQLFVNSGAAEFSDPARFPWTMGWLPNLQLEGSIYGRYVLKNKPNARIGILFQNDDFGRDLTEGFMQALGPNASKMVIARESHEFTDPTVNSQLIKMRGLNVDTLILFTIGKFTSQSIRAVRDQGWDAQMIIPNVSTSLGILRPAGLDNAKGIISATYQKVPGDPTWANDPGYKEWAEWLKKYLPNADHTDTLNVTGYNQAQALVHVLKQAGDDLTRANIMKQAASLQNLSLPMLVPGIAINTGPKDFSPIEQMIIERFDGTRWVSLGNAVGK